MSEKQEIHEHLEEITVQDLTCSSCADLSDVIKKLQSLLDKYKNKYHRIYLRDYCNYEYVDIHAVGVRKENKEELENRLEKEAKAKAKKRAAAEKKLAKLQKQIEDMED